MYETIASVTTKYKFTHPVELGDCAHVRAELLGVLPKGYGVEVSHRIKLVQVFVWNEKKERVYAREMIVG